MSVKLLFLLIGFLGRLSTPQFQVLAWPKRPSHNGILTNETITALSPLFTA